MAKPEIALAQGGPPMQPRWVTTLVRSGTVTTPTGNQDWNTPPYFGDSGNGSFSNPGTYTVSSSGTFTFTLKWKNLDGSTGANPPKYVNLRISASASAAYDNRSDMGFQVTGSGTADNGRSASAVAASPGPGMVSSSVEYETKDSSSGTVTITISPNATSTITVGSGNTQACHALVSCHATIDILNHAHPCNYRKTVGIESPAGVLHFEYAWDSTSGSLADLSNCTIRETVDYPGMSNPINLPNPPWIGWNLDNPTHANLIPGTDGKQQDNHSYASFSPNLNGYWSFSGLQVYQFHCSYANCMQTDEWAKMPGSSGTFTIQRDVGNIPPYAGHVYRIRKDGVVGYLNLP